MTKSVIIPLVNLVVQPWFQRISCVVLGPGETMEYLGCLIGFNVTPQQETDFLMGKVRKQICHWANCTLSFVGRIVLLRHAIWAMPIYHLMSMSLNSKGFKELEGISRDFLWGKNKLGDNCLALVAWQDIAQRKAKGGIGIDDLHHISLVLEMRWVSCIINEDPSAWVFLARASISRNLCLEYHCRTRRQWTILEAILFDDQIHITSSPLI